MKGTEENKEYRGNGRKEGEINKKTKGKGDRKNGERKK